MNTWILLADGPGYAGFLGDFNTTLWSAVLRIVEAMVAAAPYLVAGVFAAGILRGMVGAERTRAILGVGHWSGPFRAWGLGILLPICSLGALPVARELRRAGIPSGTVLSFVLVAPVLNPVSIIYGLSHIDPTMLLYFAAGTFAVSVGIGLLWNRLVAENKDAVPDRLERAPRGSRTRLAVVGVTAARGLVGPAFVDCGLALLAVGVLGAFLPHAALQTGLTRDNPWAPIVMGLVAIPAYVTPTEVMMHFGHIVRDGFSLGAAFALIVLGAGANVGVANWLRRDYGVQALMLFVGLLLGSTLVIGFTADRTLQHTAASQTDHTHAFDPFTRLAEVGDRQANLQWVVNKVYRESGQHEIYGLGLLVLVALAGMVLAIWGKHISVDDLMREGDSRGAPSAISRWNPALSPRQLVAVGVTGMLALALVGLYIFYPTTETLLDDMVNIRFGARDAVKEENLVESKRRLAQLRSQIRKLPTSARIRFRPVTEQQQKSVQELLYCLETIEKYADSDRFLEAQMLLHFLEKKYSECSAAFREKKS